MSQNSCCVCMHPNMVIWSLPVPCAKITALSKLKSYCHLLEQLCFVLSFACSVYCQDCQLSKCNHVRSCAMIANYALHTLCTEVSQINGSGRHSQSLGYSVLYCAVLVLAGQVCFLEWYWPAAAFHCSVLPPGSLPYCARDQQQWNILR